jgi:hypothetical protein
VIARDARLSFSSVSRCTFVSSVTNKRNLLPTEAVLFGIVTLRLIVYMPPASKGVCVAMLSVDSSVSPASRLASLDR